MSEKSIKEIAVELGVSKTAVRKKIENLGLRSSLRLIGNQFAIDEEAEKLIIASFSSDRAPGKSETSSRSETETSSRSETDKFAFYEQELTRRDEEIVRLHGELESMHGEIQKLQDAADRNAAIISELTQTITALSKNLTAQQILHGADLERITTKEDPIPADPAEAGREDPAADPVEEQTAPPVNDQQQRRPSFWKRLFGLE